MSFSALNRRFQIDTLNFRIWGSALLQHSYNKMEYAITLTKSVQNKASLHLPAFTRVVQWIVRVLYVYIQTKAKS